MTSSCAAWQRLSDEDLNHTPKFKASWHKMEEEVQDSLSQELVEKYYEDPEAEKQWRANLQKKMEDHLATCENLECQRLKQVWAAEGMFEHRKELNK